MMNILEIKTVTIKGIVDDALLSGDQTKMSRLQGLLEQKPIFSSYYVQRRNTLLGHRLHVAKVIWPLKGPSTLTFDDHISVEGLTDKCKITLSAEQVASFEEFLP